jgi:hypothetical protein
VPIRAALRVEYSRRSLNPDTVVKTTLRVLELEKTLGRKRAVA